METLREATTKSGYLSATTGVIPMRRGVGDSNGVTPCDESKHLIK